MWSGFLAIGTFCYNSLIHSEISYVAGRAEATQHWGGGGAQPLPSPK